VSSHCIDCGSRTSGGICSNCQEELYIDTYQSEHVAYPLSQEFQDKINEQARYLKETEANE